MTVYNYDKNKSVSENRLNMAKFVSDCLDKDKNNKDFKVVYKQSETGEVIEQKVRLFTYNNGTGVAKYGKGAKTRGYELSMTSYFKSNDNYNRLFSIDRLERITHTKRFTEQEKFHRDCAKILNHLNKYNLWTDLKRDVKIMDILGLDLSRELYKGYYSYLRDKDVNGNIKRIVRNNELAKIVKDRFKDCKDIDLKNYVYEQVDIIENLSDRTVKNEYTEDYKPYTGMIYHTNLSGLASEFDIVHNCKIVKMRLSRHNDYNNDRLPLITKAMNNKESITLSGRVDYDVSFEYNAEKNKAWYSLEYKNCGNGHYYLALNDTHAIFCEDD